MLQQTIESDVIRQTTVAILRKRKILMVISTFFLILAMGITIIKLMFVGIETVSSITAILFVAAAVAGIGVGILVALLIDDPTMGLLTIELLPPKAKTILPDKTDTSA